MPSVLVANAEPLPGYRLLEPLGRGGFGEVWKCEAPGGLHKAIKFVKGHRDELHSLGPGAAQELRALQLIRTLRHPFLLSTERIEVVEGDLVIVTELADKSLHDLLVEYRKNQQPGLPRAELLNYLREAAEVLDLMNLEHGLQHLDVKPGNLFLVGRHVKVADFGLVSSLADLVASSGKTVRLQAVTPLYTSPEVFNGRLSLSSDQYSLAITYHELLTGTYPFAGQSARDLALQHAQTPPDLSHLPSSDRPLVGRALAKEPSERFPSCTGFIEALTSASGSSSPSVPAFVRPQPATEREPAGLADTHPLNPEVPANLGLSGSMGGSANWSTSASAGTLLPGYQFQECQGRSRAGEVWRARDRQGNSCQIRLVSLPDSNEASGDDPVQRLAALRHPILAEVEVLSAGSGRVAVVTQAADFHLGMRWKTCKALGLPGIPRAELLGYLRRIAMGLDALYQTEGLCHLSLSPRQLILRTREQGEQAAQESALVDFGLAELFWIPARLPLGQLNPRYAAVELFQGVVSDTSDQYSLAMIFQEMLLGLHPFRQLNARQMTSPRLRGQPDFGLLPAHDRRILTRALHADPARRFSSSLEMVLALEEAAQGEKEQGSRSRAPTLSGMYRLPARTMVPTLPTGSTRKGKAGPPLPRPDWKPALAEVVAGLASGHEVHSHGDLHYLVLNNQRIEQRCQARLVTGTARLKLDGFCQQWQAEQLTGTDELMVYAIRGSATVLQRLFGRVPTVEVVVQFRPSIQEEQTPLLIMIRPIQCDPVGAAGLLDEVGSKILRSLQNYLLCTSNREEQERYPYHQPLVLWPVGPDGQLGRSVNARGRDLSRQGITVFVTGEFPSDTVEVQMNRPNSPETLRVPGRVRSRQQVGDGQVEIEIDFHS
jgi:serine/threonine protein kinase